LAQNYFEFLVTRSTGTTSSLNFFARLRESKDDFQLPQRSVSKHWLLSG